MAKTRDFSQVIENELAKNPDLAALVEEEAFKADVATEIYKARKVAGLTQRQLAERIGTHQSVIARLESADYDGHSLTMLRKIASALNQRLKVSFHSETNVSVASSLSVVIPLWSSQDQWEPEFKLETSLPAA